MEKKRKSMRKWDLNKREPRQFDLTKHESRSFDLEKDVDANALEELKAQLLEDGKIDAEEVETLREQLYADGEIDRKEAEFLFEINDAVSDKANSPAWDEFFVNAIADHLLKDETSPGEIDEDESNWLIDKIGADGKVDGAEKKILEKLGKEAKSMPKSMADFIKSATGIAPALSPQPTGGQKPGQQPGGQQPGQQPGGQKPSQQPGGQKPQQPAVQPAGGQTSEDSPSSKKWIWWLVIIVAIVAAVLLYKSCGSEKTDVTSTPVQEQADGSVQTGDGATTPSSADDKAVAPNDAEGTDDANADGNTADEPIVSTPEEMVAPQEDAKAEQQSSNAAKPETSATQAPSAQQQPTVSTAPTKAPASPTKTEGKAGDVESEAMNVIRGDYGVAPERYDLLRQKGLDPKTIQSRVNEIIRNNEF